MIGHSDKDVAACTMKTSMNVFASNMLLKETGKATNASRITCSSVPKDQHVGGYKREDVVKRTPRWLFVV